MENLNSVCYVGQITAIKVIEGADNLELAVVGGWNCVTKKGEFEIGARVVIATTDAVIPVHLSDLMGVTSYLRKGGRVRTVKLRGVYSECLIIPASYCKQQYLKEGEDKMKELEITKYEPPIRQIQLAGGRKIKYKDNQNFHIYYKFPNLKNVPEMFTEADIVEITRKIHGTNARYGIVRKSKLSIWDKIKKFLKLTDEWINYEFVYGSHNVEKGSDTQGFYSTDVWRNIENKYSIKDKLWKYIKNSEAAANELGDGIILYGEIYGAGIQSNYEYNLKDIQFSGFDIKINGEYLYPGITKLIMDALLELPYVEVLHYGKWSQEIQDSFTFDNNIEGTKVPHEGIVIKHHTGIRQKVAKVINPAYHVFAEKHNVGDSH